MSTLLTHVKRVMPVDGHNPVDMMSLLVNRGTPVTERLRPVHMQNSCQEGFDPFRLVDRPVMPVDRLIVHVDKACIFLTCSVGLSSTVLAPAALATMDADACSAATDAIVPLAIMLTDVCVVTCVSWEDGCTCNDCQELGDCTGARHGAKGRVIPA